MKDFSAFLQMRRYKNWVYIIGSWKHLTIWRPDLPVSPPHQHSVPHFSTLNSFQGVLKVSSYRSTRLNPCGGRWQAPMASAYVWLILRTGAHFTSSWDFCLILALLLKTLSQWASIISVSHFPILWKQGLKKKPIHYLVLKKIEKCLLRGAKRCSHPKVSGIRIISSQKQSRPKRLKKKLCPFPLLPEESTDQVLLPPSEIICKESGLGMVGETQWGA